MGAAFGAGWAWSGVAARMARAVAAIGRVSRDGCAGIGGGPLGGLVTGLEHFGSEIESAILVACDLPLIQPQFIQSLHLGECDVAVPRIDGRCHPLLAAYSPSCLAIARMQLQAGQYRMADFLERLKVRELGLADLPEIESLRTANTPEEWQELLKESRG